MRLIKRLNLSLSTSLSRMDLSISNSDDETLFTEMNMSHRWVDRKTFMLYVIGYTMGFGNVLTFPYKAYKNGQGSFLIVYTLILFTIGVPMLMLEFSLGQFCGRGCTHAFRLVPLFVGLGWSMLVLAIFISIYFSISVAYGYYYLYCILKGDLSWSHCNNNFNTFSCVSCYMNNGYPNETVSLSTKEFFEFNILNSAFRYGDLENVSIYYFKYIPSFLLLLSAASVFLISLLRNIFGKRISGRVLHVTVLYPYFLYLFLLFRAVNLEGSVKGIIFFLTPRWEKMIDKFVWFEALEQMSMSLGLCTGVMITLSSFNSFHNNILFDTLSIVSITYFTNILVGFSVFATLGYLSSKYNLLIEEVINHYWEIYFVAIPTMLANLYGSPFWDLIYMFTFVCLGFNAQVGFFDTITKEIFEAFPSLNKTFKKKILLECIISFFQFCITVSLFLPRGVYWMSVIFDKIIRMSLLVIMFLEVVLVTWIYDFRLFTKDYFMMVKFSEYKYWIIWITFILPVLLVSSFIFNFIKHIMVSRMHLIRPWFADIFIFIITFVLIDPVLIGMICTIYNYNKNYSNENIFMIIWNTLKPSSDWGPYFKKDWISSNRYHSKLLLVYNDPIFKANIRDTEHFEDILRNIRRAQK